MDAPPVILNLTLDDTHHEPRAIDYDFPLESVTVSARPTHFLKYWIASGLVGRKREWGRTKHTKDVLDEFQDPLLLLDAPARLHDDAHRALDPHPLRA